MSQPEWKYWLLDAATRCSTARETHGHGSPQYVEAEARLEQIRAAVRQPADDPQGSLL